MEKRCRFVKMDCKYLSLMFDERHARHYRLVHFKVSHSTVTSQTSKLKRCEQQQQLN